MSGKSIFLWNLYCLFTIFSELYHSAREENCSCPNLFQQYPHTKKQQNSLQPKTILNFTGVNRHQFNKKLVGNGISTGERKLPSWRSIKNFCMANSAYEKFSERFQIRVNNFKRFTWSWKKSTSFLLHESKPFNFCLITGHSWKAACTNAICFTWSNYIWNK